MHKKQLHQHYSLRLTSLSWRLNLSGRPYLFASRLWIVRTQLTSSGHCWAMRLSNASVLNPSLVGRGYQRQQVLAQSRFGTRMWGSSSDLLFREGPGNAPSQDNVTLQWSSILGLQSVRSQWPTPSWPATPLLWFDWHCLTSLTHKSLFTTGSGPQRDAWRDSPTPLLHPIASVPPLRCCTQCGVLCTCLWAVWSNAAHPLWGKTTAQPNIH